MPIQIRDHRALEGPNLYYGQPAVKLQTWSDRDIRRELANLIKTWAQMTGSVIGYLQQEVAQADGGYLVTTTFTTPFPNVGDRIVEAAVVDLQAAERGDREYSHDDLLFEIIRQRQREEPPMALLQVYAEARARDLPFLPRGDGTIMLGSGSRGFIFDPSGLGVGLTVEIPWPDIRRVPVIAIAGATGATTAGLCAHILAATGKRVGHAGTAGITIAGAVIESGDRADFAGARRVLTDPEVDVAILEVSRESILQQGLGFDVCDVSVLTDVSTEQMDELPLETLDEMARVQGVIALVTEADGRVVLNATDERLLELEQYINAPIMWFSHRPELPRLLAHREAGQDAVWSDASAIHITWKGTHTQLSRGDLPILDDDATPRIESVLAAIAACVALGIDVASVVEALRTFPPTCL